MEKINNITKQSLEEIVERNKWLLPKGIKVIVNDKGNIKLIFEEWKK